MLWQSIPELAFCQFKGNSEEVVVYNRRSGDTHLLELSAAHVLSTLTPAPLDLNSLTEKLARQWSVEPNGEMRHAVGEILTNLAELSLVNNPVAS